MSEVTSHKFFDLVLVFNSLQMQNFPLYLVSKKVAFSYFPNWNIKKNKQRSHWMYKKISVDIWLKFSENLVTFIHIPWFTQSDIEIDQRSNKNIKLLGNLKCFIINTAHARLSTHSKSVLDLPSTKLIWLVFSLLLLQY